MLNPTQSLDQAAIERMAKALASHLAELDPSGKRWNEPLISSLIAYTEFVKEKADEEIDPRAGTSLSELRLMEKVEGLMDDGATMEEIIDMPLVTRLYGIMAEEGIKPELRELYWFEVVSAFRNLMEAPSASTLH